MVIASVILCVLCVILCGGLLALTYAVNVSFSNRLLDYKAECDKSLDYSNKLRCDCEKLAKYVRSLMPNESNESNDN